MMRFLLESVIVLLVSATHASPLLDRASHGQPVTTLVDLGYAKYEGTNLPGVQINQWLGMRFAAPPLGDFRWRSPQPPPSMHDQGVQPAKEFQATCIGLFGPGLSNTTNEDCLFVNVFAPANATTTSKLPVWFFIQGGGYAGDTDQNFNATDVILNSQHNMVFVQINYRVGAFGFLASDQIRNNGDLNVGLLDQRYAMHWVQKYIHLFGGDPEHVVIHGDSAGAGSVAFHLTAYGGRNDNLFVGAMAESPFWPTHRTVAESESQFSAFAANVSCPNNDKVMSCLRSKSTEVLQSADYVRAFPGTTGNPLPDWYFLPVIDGTFSVDYLYNLFDQGRVVRVPLVVGDDTDEGTAFSPNVNSQAAFLDFIKANYPRLTRWDLDLIAEAYPENGFGSFPQHADWFPAEESAYGESTFICPGIAMANSLSTYHSPASTWQYRYNVQDQGYITAGLGVPHVSEKPAIFGVNSTGPCNGCSYETYNAAIVPVLMSYWVSFILHLDPNVKKDPAAPTWKSWESNEFGDPWEKQRLKIQTNATAMECVPVAQQARCLLWNGLVFNMQQK